MLKPTLCKSIRLPVLITSLVTLIIFSSVMAVLAWTDFTQSRTNDFRGIVRTVELIKQEKNLKGDIILHPVASAVFSLYKQMSDDSWIPIPGNYTTDGFGKITLKKLSSGSYKFVETNPGYGYQFDIDEFGADITVYPFIITDTATDTAVLVEAYNRRKISGLKIKKTVIDAAAGPAAVPFAKADETDEDNKADEDYDLLSEEDFSPEKADPNNEDAKVNAFSQNEENSDEENLDQENLDQNSDQENIVEENNNTAEENEDPSSETDNNDDDISDYSDNYSALSGADPEKEFLFKVTFRDGGSEDGAYEYSIDGGAKQWLTSGETISLKHGQTAYFAELPVGLYYEVTEIADPDFTTKSRGNSGSIKLDEISLAEFINSKGKPLDKGKVDIIVKKVVEGEIPDSELDRIFKFYIKKNDDEAKPFYLKAGETKTFQFDYGDTYAITEDDPFSLGYLQTSVINGAGTACNPEITVTYTNTYIGLKWKTIRGEKTWDLSGFAGAKLPDSITIELLAKGTVVDTAIVKADSKGDWFYSFIAPKFDTDGKEIEYTIREVPVPGFSSRISGNDIQNTWVGTVTSAPAKLEKIVSGNAPSTPETYHFTLEALGGAPLPSGAAGKTISISITGKGTANFGDITFLNPGSYYYEISEAEVKGSASKCDYDGTVYTLTVLVEEESGSLVVKSIAYTKPDGTVVPGNAVFTNYYNSSGGGHTEPPGPVEKVNLSIKKIWAGDPNPNQPQSIAVQLFKDGKPQGNPITLNQNNNWRYTWTGLDKGPAWTVDETTIPTGYTKSITGNASSGFLITNTWFKPTDIPPEKAERVTVRGQKTWNHGNNPLGSRPLGIVIYIKDGNRIAASAMITDTDHWQWCFILPKLRADGSVANYSVDEDPLTDYSKEINGYSLINTYKPGGDSSTKPGSDEPGSDKPGQKTDGSSDGKSAKDGQKSPKTGDSSNLLFWLILLFLSSVALIITVYATRRGRRG